MARTKHRLRPADRRALIEDAAARLFAERGYAAARLDDIAAAANVTKPMLYRHFASKRALHLTLLTKHRDELFAQVIEHVTPEEPMQPQLHAILDAWFGYVEQNPYAWKMLFRDTTGDPEIQAFHLELHASARSLLTTLIRPDEIDLPQQEIEPLAEIVRSATTGLALWWLEHRDTPRQILVDAMTRVIAGLIQSPR
ncbi:MAG: TetR/AcrR family transcriptional regulator [Solirubrobacteraceae bacterium]